MRFEVVECVPKSYKRTKNILVIEEFMSMDAQVVKLINDGEYKDNMSMRNSLAISAKRFNYGVKVIMSKNEVFLTKSSR